MAYKNYDMLSLQQKVNEIDNKCEKDYVDEKVNNINSDLEEKANKTDVNDKFSKVNSSLEEKANKSTTNNIQSQINTLVLESGTSDTEVAQARVDNEGNVFPTLKSNIDNISNLLLNNEYKISWGDWTQGAVQSSGTENTDSKYIRTSEFHTFDEIVEIIPSDGINYRIAKYNSDGTVNKIGNFITSKTIIGVDDTVKYKFTIGKTDGSDIVPSENNLLTMKVNRNITYNENGASFINVSNNLVDNKNMKLNTMLNASTGEEEENSSYAVTDFIPYKLFQKIYVSRYRNYVMYDKDKNFLLVNATTTTDKTEIQITTSSMIDVAYVRFTVYKQYAPTTIVSYTDYTEQDEYGLFIDKLRLKKENLGIELQEYIENLASQTNSRICGLTAYGFGDSLVKGHYSGEGMIDRLATELNLSYTKYAVNGATVVEGSNSILTQIANASTTVPDFIFFDGSTNDAYTKTTMGSISDDYSGTYDTSTFCGAFEQICYNLRNKYMTSNIIYITPHKMPTRDKTVQETINGLVLQMCNKWQIQVVDMYNKGQINCNLAAMRNAYSYNNEGETSGGNGTHLTGDGYDKWYTPPIRAKMLEMI